MGEEILPTILDEFKIALFKKLPFSVNNSLTGGIKQIITEMITAIIGGLINR
jgi:hypothetical protein